MAFTAWGDPAGAGPILDRYLGSVRMSDSAGQPYGSLAESFYANGEPASPRFIVDDRGPARLLFAAERYVMSLPDDQRRAWITRHADRIRAAAEFLTGWADRRRGAPLWCADPVGLSDAVSQSRVFDQYAGVSAAIRVFRAIGQDVPETWTQRRETLGGLADWILTTRSAAWSPARALVLEFRDLPGPSHEALSAQTLAALGAGRDHDYEQGAMVAAQAVLLIEAADPGVEGLDREQVWEAIDGSSYADVAPLPCDSYASGLALFAAAVLTTP
jgi:hypothetical protein